MRYAFFCLHMNNDITYICTAYSGSRTEPTTYQTAACDNTVRLLRKSAVAVDVTPKVFVQTRPDLLAHR